MFDRQLLHLDAYRKMQISLICLRPLNGYISNEMRLKRERKAKNLSE
jgi:hypothetical protein